MSNLLCVNRFPWFKIRRTILHQISRLEAFLLLEITEASPGLTALRNRPPAEVRDQTWKNGEPGRPSLAHPPVAKTGTAQA